MDANDFSNTPDCWSPGQTSHAYHHCPPMFVLNVHPHLFTDLLWFDLSWMIKILTNYLQTINLKLSISYADETIFLWRISSDVFAFFLCDRCRGFELGRYMFLFDLVHQLLHIFPRHTPKSLLSLLPSRRPYLLLKVASKSRVSKLSCGWIQLDCVIFI